MGTKPPAQIGDPRKIDTFSPISRVVVGVVGACGGECGPRVRSLCWLHVVWGTGHWVMCVAACGGAEPGRGYGRLANCPVFSDGSNRRGVMRGPCVRSQIGARARKPDGGKQWGEKKYGNT